MDLNFTEEQKAFRKEVASFIERELPKDISDEDDGDEAWQFSLTFAKKLAERGWLCIGWPTEYGGGGRSLIDQAIFGEEVYYHRAAFHSVVHAGIYFVGPGLMHFGTEEQKRRILPLIAKGEIRVGQAFSEPEVGSDLSSLKTRAVRDGDYYVVNGQKTYQSWARRNDMTVVAARTDLEANKYRGISLMLCDLHSPGVTVRPLNTIDGLSHLDEIFFDNVRIPRQNLIGAENDGWNNLATILTFERSTSGLRVAGARRRDFDDFVQFCRDARRGGKALCENPFVRHKLVEMATELEVLSLLAWRVFWLSSQKIVPSTQASALNLGAKEWQRRFVERAMEILGVYGQLEPGSKGAPMNGRIEHLFMRSFGLSAAATPEIMKNLMAVRGLGLPRG
ncbi:MAG: acyl-CoA dehydrogenase family protein [Chloroflexi bacterium]|nr:acyl-CoA dehydrogenase family protein [Chloroflexota bacterium]